MKNKLKIFLFLCTALWQTGCYDDKGNYSYTEISDIGINGIEENYRRIAMLDTLHIPVSIKTEYPVSDLSYTWFIYNTDYTDATGDHTSADTISCEKDLVYEVLEKAGTYKVVLKVQNKTNNYTVYGEALLRVETIFSRGFYVLKATADGQTEMDFKPAESELMENLLTKSLGVPLAGKPQVLAQMMDYPYIDPAQNKKVMGHALGITTDETATLMVVSNMSLLHDHNTMFFEAGHKGKPGRFARGWKELYISHDGCYVIDPGSEALGSGRFSWPSELSGGSPWMAFCAKEKGFIYWDEVNGRFLSVDMDGNVRAYEGNDAEYQPNGIQDKLEFLGTTRYADETIYAVFRNTAGKCKLYTIPGNLFGSRANPIQSVMEIGANSEFSKADYFAINVNSAPLLYFIANGKLWYYDPKVENEIEISGIEKLPADEKITYVSNRFWKSRADNITFDYLVIGTSKENHYTVSMYEMIGGQPKGAPVIQFAGTGSIADIQYMSPSFGGSMDIMFVSYGMSFGLSY